MKVKELVEKLQSLDQNLDVCFYVDERDCERLVGSVKCYEVDIRYDREKNEMLKEMNVVLTD